MTGSLPKPSNTPLVVWLRLREKLVQRSGRGHDEQREDSTPDDDHPSQYSTGTRRCDARLAVLLASARRGAAPTPLARRTGDEAAPIVLPALGALSVLIAVGRLDRAPVVPSNQATPVSCHEAFLPGSRMSLDSGGV